MHCLTVLDIKLVKIVCDYCFLFVIYKTLSKHIKDNIVFFAFSLTAFKTTRTLKGCITISQKTKLVESNTSFGL